MSPRDGRSRRPATLNHAHRRCAADALWNRRARARADYAEFHLPAAYDRRLQPRCPLPANLPERPQQRRRFRESEPGIPRRQSIESSASPFRVLHQTIRLSRFELMMGFATHRRLFPPQRRGVPMRPDGEHFGIMSLPLERTSLPAKQESGSAAHRRDQSFQRPLAQGLGTYRPVIWLLVALLRPIVSNDAPARQDCVEANRGPETNAGERET